MNLRLTLRFRIITLIALFAIVLVSAFTALLINRQLRVINQNNQYRARIGTFAAKGAFERTLLSAIRTGDPPSAFQKLIPLLKEGQLAEEVTIADLKGKVVAAENPLRVGSVLTEEDLLWAGYARKNYSPQTWFHARVNPGEIVFYAPIVMDDSPKYVAVFRYSLGNMKQAIQQVAKVCVLVAIGVMGVMVPLCLLLIRAILGPIQILNHATKEIAAGNLGLKVHVPTEDELGELAQTFNGMTSALVKMKERAENANPLTKLPGNNVIHEEIEKRIKRNTKFVAVYADLDNFKAYNDKYGIAAGDAAIQFTAQIMRQAMKQGNPTDFLGHEGGDDFIILTTPEKAEAVTSYICTEFDRWLSKLYAPEDRKQGYIISKDREGSIKQFPLMTISLAGVTNAHRRLASYAEVTNVCAEVKKKAKEISKGGGKSAFFLDRRSGEERAQAPASEPNA